MVRYKRGEIILMPFPFIIEGDRKQKLRPALVISDDSINRRFSDVILLAVTSKIPNEIFRTEYLIKDFDSFFQQTGLKKSSVIRGEFIMTVPESLIIRKIGNLSEAIMEKIDGLVKISLGVKG